MATTVVLTIQSGEGTQADDSAATYREARCERCAMEEQAMEPTQCTRYRLGHGLDLAEAKLAWRYAVQKPVLCRLLDFQRDGIVTLLDEDGHHHEVWNHDPQKLIRLTSRSDVQVSIAPFNHHLRVFSGGRWYAISFCSEVDRTPCDFSPA